MTSPRERKFVEYLERRFGEGEMMSRMEYMEARVDFGTDEVENLQLLMFFREIATAARFTLMNHDDPHYIKPEVLGTKIITTASDGTNWRLYFP